MRENQAGGAKYLNTSDSEIYHKRSQLFGIDLARSVAARAGRMILVEGYTDVLALHQAGLRNSVGIMGTALTEEQVQELERTVKVLDLCLDADSAGQDAMIRAARLAEGRKPPLELRVVPLSSGTDPAELVEREGADALRRRVDASVAFVAFRVGHILDRADSSSAEGRDRALAELRPVFEELPPSALRDDLIRKVSGRLELTKALTASLTDGPPRNGHVAVDEPGERAVPTLDQGLRAERAFLALCIAVPDEGATALDEIDPDQLLTSDLYRRAARHLAGRTHSPLSDLPVSDDELARAVADLVARAGRSTDASPARLQHARLLLELARLDRALVRARASGEGGITELARKRQQVQQAIHGVVTSLESAV
jgi:DNA primase